MSLAALTTTGVNAHAHAHNSLGNVNASRFISLLPPTLIIWVLRSLRGSCAPHAFPNNPLATTPPPRIVCNLSHCSVHVHHFRLALSLSLSLYLSLSLALSLSLSLSLYLSRSLSLSLYLSRSFSLYLARSLYLSRSRSRSISLALALSRSISLTRSLAESRSLNLSRSISLSLLLYLALFRSRSRSISFSLSLYFSRSRSLSLYLARSLALSRSLSRFSFRSRSISLALALTLRSRTFYILDRKLRNSTRLYIVPFFFLSSFFASFPLFRGLLHSRPIPFVVPQGELIAAGESYEARYRVRYKASSEAVLYITLMPRSSLKRMASPFLFLSRFMYIYIYIYRMLKRCPDQLLRFAPVSAPPFRAKENVGDPGD